MGFSFDYLSIGSLRKECIVRYLKDTNAEHQETHIYITGKTNSGKTTFENMLIAGKSFLERGTKDTTTTVQLIEFPNGLSFFDLPGIEGRERKYENINRFCLRLPQRDYHEQINSIDVVMASLDNAHVISKNYSINEYQQNKRFEAHLIYYIIGSKHGIIKEEKKYIQHIIEKYKVIFIINEFENNDIEKARFDIENTLKEIAGSGNNKNKLVMCVMDCRTGRGLEELFRETERLLGKVKGSALSRVLWYQYQKTPVVFRDKVFQILMKVTKELSNESPGNWIHQKSILKEYAIDIFKFLCDIREKLSQTEYGQSDLFPADLFTEVFEELDKACTIEKIVKKRKEEPYEHDGQVQMIIKAYDEVAIEYTNYSLEACVQLTILLLLVNEILLSRIPDKGELAQLYKAIKQRKNIIPLSEDRTEGLYYYLLRLQSQFFGTMLNRTIIQTGIINIESFIDEYVKLPYIFYFKAADRFLVSSLGTNLSWSTENASICYLDDTLNKKKVDLNNNHFDLVLLKDASLTLSVENEYGDRTVDLQIRVYQPPKIELMDMSSLNIAIDPINLKNPQFDLSTHISFGGNLHLPVSMNLKPYQDKTVHSTPEFTGEEPFSQFVLYSFWNSNFIKKLKITTDHIPEYFQKLKKSIFNLYQSTK